MLYIVIEIQSNGTTCSTIPWAYDTEQAAQAKYFAVCSAAVASSVPIHTVIIMTDRGELIRSERFYHAGVAPHEE